MSDSDYYQAPRGRREIQVRGEPQSMLLKVPLQKRTDVINSTRTIHGEAHDLSAGVDDPKWKIWVVDTIGSETHEYFVQEDPQYVHKWSERESLATPAAFTNANSVSFDGVDSYLDAGDSYLYDNATQWSLSAWVKANNVAAQRAIYSKATTDANVFGVGIYHNNTGKIFLQMRASGQLRSHTSNLGLTAGVWHHLVFTYSGAQNINGARIYIDSVVGTTPSSGSITNTLLYNQDALFGRRGTSFHLSGFIDEISIWNKALSAAEVASVYNSGSPQDVRTLSFADDLANFYRNGDGDTTPLVLDNEGSTNLTMEGSAAFDTDIP